MIEGYHAHVYFATPAEAEVARSLRAKLEAGFSVALGRWNAGPIGPHLCGSFEIAIPTMRVGELLSWLLLERGELDILLHPLTGDDLVDHTDHALWLGAPRSLRLEAFGGAS
jgi:aromatic ring-cleaving dioxygenase